MPIPAACVRQAHRISQSSGCPGICLLLGQIFDFWPMWGCQWAWQLRRWGLAMDTWVVFLGFSLLVAPEMAFRAPIPGRKSHSHPCLWSMFFLLSDSLAVLCYLAGAIRQHQSGGLVCLSVPGELFLLLHPPTCPRVSEEWRPPAAVSPSTQTMSVPMPAFSWSDTEKERKCYTKRSRPKSHKHKRDEPPSLFGCIVISTQQWFMLYVTESTSPYKTEKVGSEMFGYT